MRYYGNSRAFNLVELLATLTITAVLITMVVVYVPQLVDWAKQTSDKQTLTVLNDALSRYKTEGGGVGGLNKWTPISQVISSLKTGVTWGGVGHQFLNNGKTYLGRSVAATGTGAQYRFTRYNYFTAEPGTSPSDLGLTGGLVAHWSFDEGSGTTAVDTAGGNSGTLNGGCTWSTGPQVDSALPMDRSQPRLPAYHAGQRVSAERPPIRGRKTWAATITDG